MSIEIEIKAWVEDTEAASKAISSFAVFKNSYAKDDEYWQSPEHSFGSGIRLRQEGGVSEGAIVNFKQKEVRDGMEVNDEREFSVSDAQTFTELLRRLGFAPWIRKQKIGTAWDYQGITIELSEIVGLGTFVELEILEENDDRATVESARRRLLACLKRIGIKGENIEERFYTQMLASRKSL
ncbi:hypothetical protein MASR2M78_25710 [Treponema sp.]